VSERFLQLLKTELVIHVGSEARLTPEGGGVRINAGGESLWVDKVFVALGRRPNIDHLGLDKLDVALDAHGLPPYDPTSLQIADLPVFIAGDANNLRPILHEAADEGFIAGRNAVAEHPQCYRRRTSLAITFSDPCIAWVGRRRDSLGDGEYIEGRQISRTWGVPWLRE
jgi:dihydrolipoamide dehydrogenase